MLSNTTNCYFGAGDFRGYFWSTNIAGYLYSSRALFVLYEAQLDNNATYFKSSFTNIFK